MATLYATVAEEKNALLQAILSKNQKQIHQCLLRAEHINRKDKAIIEINKSGRKGPVSRTNGNR